MKVATKNLILIIESLFLLSVSAALNILNIQYCFFIGVFTKINFMATQANTMKSYFFSVPAGANAYAFAWPMLMPTLCAPRSIFRKFLNNFGSILGSCLILVSEVFWKYVLGMFLVWFKVWFQVCLLLQVGVPA